MSITFFKSSSRLREWLEKSHDKARELWVGFYKTRSKRQGITYKEALDEALCFGWIDGVRKSVGEMSYTIRFSPRKPRSNWSVVNIRRAGELTALGRMKPSGRKAFDERERRKSGRYSYEDRPRRLDRVYEKKFRVRKRAWNFFQGQAPSYQRAACWWVMSPVKEETRLKRLATLIEASGRGRRVQ